MIIFCIVDAKIALNGKGSRKKSSSFNGRAIKRKENFFWKLFFQRSKISTAIKLEGGNYFLRLP